jgi:hypothetical protein
LSVCTDKLILAGFHEVKGVADLIDVAVDAPWPGTPVSGEPRPCILTPDGGKAIELNTGDVFVVEPGRAGF